MRSSAVTAILLCVSLAGTAHAQVVEGTATAGSRQELLRQTRQEKAGGLAPYEAGKIERWLLRLEDGEILEKLFLTSAGGWYARLGKVTTGSGIALGPGYRRRAVGGRALEYSVGAGVSLKKYWLAEATIVAPHLADRRLFVGGHVRRKEFPQEDFFGLGPDSFRPNRVSYAFRQTEFGGVAGVRITPWLTTGAEIEFLAPSVGHGEDTRIPSLEELFTPDQAPGFAVQPDFIRYGAHVDLDYSEPAGNPRAGGRYLVSYDRFDDRDGNGFGFERVDVDLRQYVSFFKQRRVLALRALASFSNAGEGQTVPFYYMRTIGGGDSLRGFRDFRFRDENLLLLQAEYRWEIFPALDAAFFFDAGKVAPEMDGLGLNGMETDYGFGFRFGSNQGVFLRIDSAFGSTDGPHLFIKFGHFF